MKNPSPRTIVLYVILASVPVFSWLYVAYADKFGQIPIIRHDYLLNKFERSDELGRIISYPNKVEVGCPKAGDGKTAVLLIIGQSNSGNYAGQRYRSEHGEQVINFFAGRCYLASSPLLGASGIGGESFTLLANKMIESKI